MNGTDEDDLEDVDIEISESEPPRKRRRKKLFNYQEYCDQQQRQQNEHQHQQHHQHQQLDMDPLDQYEDPPQFEPQSKVPQRRIVNDSTLHRKLKELNLAGSESDHFVSYHNRLRTVLVPCIVQRTQNGKCFAMAEWNENRKFVNRKYWVHVQDIRGILACSGKDCENKETCDHMVLYHLIRAGNHTGLKVTV